MASSAVVYYDDRHTDVPAIRAAIVALGYFVELLDTTVPAGLHQPKFDAEARRWRRGFLLSLPFTAPVFLLSMVLRHIPGPISNALHAQVAPGLSVYALASWLLTTPVLFWLGAPFFRGAFAAVSP